MPTEPLTHADLPGRSGKLSTFDRGGGNRYPSVSDYPQKPARATTCGRIRQGRDAHVRSVVGIASGDTRTSAGSRRSGRAA